MNFGDALHNLKNHGQVARSGWNGKGMWVDLQRPDAFSKMTLPYLYLNYPPSETGAHPEGARVPWLASQTDLLAEDWFVVSAQLGG